MHYTVYQITNKVNGKIYIGVHQTEDLDDGYYGSGFGIQKAIKKYGLESFDKQILYIFETPEEMFSKEAELVNEDFVKRSDTYNAKVGGFGGWDYVHFKGLHKLGGSSSQKVLKEKKEDPEYRKKISESISKSLKIRWETQVNPFLGKFHTQETKQKIGFKNSKNQSGQKNSQYGTCWIHSVSLKENKKIPKNDLDKWIDKGYNLGRKMKF